MDAHVHFYPPYSLRRFFDSAADNFASARRALGLPPAEVAGYLLLAEGDEPPTFETWRDRAAGELAGSWILRGTREAESLVARRKDGAAVVVVAGRQVRTEDGLEVLALCTGREFAEGRKLAATVRSVRRSGTIPVIPWGFGKWWGRRGELVAELLRSERPGSLILGDNAGRPALAPRPGLFRRAREKRIPILPGTDPLPFPGEEDGVGAFGAALRLDTDLERPAARLRERLAALRRTPARYGTGESLARFLRLQVRMQMRKRMSARGLHGRA